MGMTRASAMNIINANGGIELLHSFVYHGNLFIPCHKVKNIGDVNSFTRKQKNILVYVSRIGTEVFLEDNFIRAKTLSEWSAGQETWKYYTWDYISNLEMLPEEYRDKVNS